MKKLIALITILIIIYFIIPDIKILNIQMNEVKIPQTVNVSRDSNLRSYNIKNYSLTVDMDLRIKSHLDY